MSYRTLQILNVIIITICLYKSVWAWMFTDDHFFMPLTYIVIAWAGMWFMDEISFRANFEEFKKRNK